MATLGNDTQRTPANPRTDAPIGLPVAIGMELRPSDPIISQIKFQIFRSKVERAVEQFLPEPNDPQTKQVIASWGPEEVRAGDYIGSEIGNSKHQWRIAKDVFESTYEWVCPGIARKNITIQLYPLAELTRDPDMMVKIFTYIPSEQALDPDKHCVERAGDVYLALGAKGELYRYPIAKAEKEVVRVG